MQTAIWWIRRDLRLADNQALSAARQQAITVLPVFIFDPAISGAGRAPSSRLNFLKAALHSLNTELRARGSRLLVLHGSPLEALSRLVSLTGAQAVFAEADHSPFARRRDQAVALQLPLRLVGSPAIAPPGTVVKTDGTPYTVFTPFARTWHSLPGMQHLNPVPAPEHLPFPDLEFTPEDSVQALLLADFFASPTELLPASASFAPDLNVALRRLDEFTGAQNAPIYAYAEGRNRLDQEGTARLSPYLRFGLLSARQAAAQAQHLLLQAHTPAERKGAETWINELVWRDFYIHILHHFPKVLEGNFRPKRIRWLNQPADLEAWRSGQTGYPVVDAAMRQLFASGWMHNRARMVVASFLTKHLLVDWRQGERWFMQHLVDGDPAANNGGWQWTAGTGTDAAPYFRVFNPTLQGKRSDPSGRFVRRWLTELEAVPDEFIHEPWKMPLTLQMQLDIRIGRDYPAPRIDHTFARQRLLAVYDASHQGAEKEAVKPHGA